jgi:PLP dependent protein
MFESSPELCDLIAANLRHVQERIVAAAEQAGRDPAEVTLIVVSKRQSVEAIWAAYDAGAHYFGESRVQEAQAKIPAVHLAHTQWEMIGTLQRNKARVAVEMFKRLHSIDSLALVEAVARAAAERGRVMEVLLQVNVAGEATKHGITPAEVLPLARAIQSLPALRGVGLMTVAPIVDDPEDVRPIFRRLRELRDTLRHEVSDDWRELSMGMTDDFAAAIAEGATLVRIGRAIFGERE